MFQLQVIPTEQTSARLLHRCHPSIQLEETQSFEVAHSFVGFTFIQRSIIRVCRLCSSQSWHHRNRQKCSSNINRWKKERSNWKRLFLFLHPLRLNILMNCLRFVFNRHEINALHCMLKEKLPQVILISLSTHIAGSNHYVTDDGHIKSRSLANLHKLWLEFIPFPSLRCTFFKFNLSKRLGIQFPCKLSSRQQSQSHSINSVCALVENKSYFFTLHVTLCDILHVTTRQLSQSPLP